MNLRLLSWLFAGVLLASTTLRAQAPAVAEAPKVMGGAGLILVAKVSGTVNMTLNGATKALALNDPVSQSAKINTQKGASVVLIFSNGATTQLGENSEMIIEQYLQDPFAEQVVMANITDEPSVSTTKLKLNHGELVGKVAHLKHDKGSTFVIDTPVGAAGIRGTTFRIVFTPSGTGQAFFQLSTLEGNVAFGTLAANGGTPNQGTPGGNNGTTNPNGATAQGSASVAVPTGQAITVTVDVSVNAQGVTVVTVLPPAVNTTVAIPPAVAAQVSQVAADISVAVQQATFTATPSSPGTGTGSTTTTTSGSVTTNGTTTTSTTTTTTTGNTTTTTTTAGGSTTTSTTTTNADNSKPGTVSGANKDTGTSFNGVVVPPPQHTTPGDGLK